MLFSLEWLVKLGLPEVDSATAATLLTARGLTVDSVDSTRHGEVLDVDIPANRPDCLGHRGLARELAAALGCTLTPALDSPPALGPGGPWASVRIDAPDLCARYTATLVRGVKVGPSPAWVVRQLEACGLRSISNVVDASNLVLLELGQPIHFFDYDALLAIDGDPPSIVVRRAAAGELLRTLDDSERKLDDTMLVIAGRERALALAGVMGGAESEIGDATTQVLIEAAGFRAQSVRATARRLSAQSDASFRFERGIDPAGIVHAQALACSLLVELAGGRPETGMLDAGSQAPEPRQLELRRSRLRRLLGFAPDSATTLSALTALDLAPEAKDEDTTVVQVPSWRPDLTREADLVEEVARHVGYDNIPTTLPLAESVEPESAAPLDEPVRDVLGQLGFHEAVGYAMIAEDEDLGFLWEAQDSALALTNPIAAPLSHLRRSVLPGLLRATDLNQRRGTRDVRLFETGRIFIPSPKGLPDEPLHLGLAWSGSGQPDHWSVPHRAVDLQDLSGIAERVLASLRPGLVTRRVAGAPAAFHPGRSVHWTTTDGRRVAWGGALDPAVQERLEHPTMMLEVDLDAVATQERSIPRHSAISRFPAVSRDIAVVMPSAIDYATLLGTLRAVDAPAPTRFTPVDRYEGPPLGPDESSLTIRILIEPRDRTLTDEETEGYREDLVRRLRQDLGLEVRT